jgi:tetrapyrrole methylase family protein/MazG family protein
VEDRHPFDALRSLCARLRAPEGCPWDRAQSLESLKAYIIEEAYEVVDGIAGGDPARLCSELGDLLFQIVFVARIAEEQRWFDMLDVCRSIHAKMVRRHPHVFGETAVSSPAEVVRNWERIKRHEGGEGGALAGVPRHLPALLKALRITEKAAALGFDWERVSDVTAKLEEEVGELAEHLERPRSEREEQDVREELGDVLFVMANLARQLGLDPEAALQGANDKFVRRFTAMEALARQRGLELAALSTDELNELWDGVKAREEV